MSLLILKKCTLFFPCIVLIVLCNQHHFVSEHVFMEHKRTVNRVCFHEKEHYQLLSASQDGQMKLFVRHRFRYAFINY